MDCRYIYTVRFRIDILLTRLSKYFTTVSLLIMFLSTSLISKLALLTAAVNGALVRVTDFGTNPTNLQMNIWVPSKLAAKPAIILAVR
jgi:hypothetical protein